MFALCPLAGRDRRHAHRDRGRSRISIHAPHAGRDNHIHRRACVQLEFQSTRPMRGATPMAIHRSLPMPFQSTRPARGATCPHGQYGRGTFYFNPRAAIRIRSRRRWYFNPRAPRGARLWNRRFVVTARNFNPRAPRGARPTLRRCWEGRTVFQSTRPMRGATATTARPTKCFDDFNPRAPCGARRPGCCHSRRGSWHFNPRAPCGARHYKYVIINM